MKYPKFKIKGGCSYKKEIKDFKKEPNKVKNKPL